MKGEFCIIINYNIFVYGKNKTSSVYDCTVEDVE